MPFGSPESEGEQEALLWLESEVPILLLILVPLDSRLRRPHLQSVSPPAFHLSVLAPSADDLQILLRPLT